MTDWLNKEISGTSLVVQWLRIHLPMQGTWVGCPTMKSSSASTQLEKACAQQWRPSTAKNKVINLKKIFLSKSLIRYKEEVNHSIFTVHKIFLDYPVKMFTDYNGHVKSFSCVRLFVTPWTVAYQASPSLGFSRQEYWNGLLFPSPGDLPDPGIEPGSPTL